MKIIRSIKQASELTNLSIHTLRYYEKIGLLKEIKRDEHGYRQYSEADISWISFLLRLRSTGMAIENMINFSNLRSEGNSTIKERRNMLEIHREHILDEINRLKENLENIDEKITYYKDLEKNDC